MSSNCTVSCTGTPKMSLGRLSYQISNYFTAGRVSALSNLPGYSTQVGNSTRSYVRNFWEKGTAMPARGHMHKGKRLDGYNKNLYVSYKSLGFRWGGHEIGATAYNSRIQVSLINLHIIIIFLLDKTMGRAQTLETQ